MAQKKTNIAIGAMACVLFLLVKSSGTSGDETSNHRQNPKDNIRISTLVIEPYLMINPRYANTTNPKKYYGYTKDLLDEISRVLNFRYDLAEVPDGRYGYLQKNNGEWNGLIGQLHKEEIDIAAAPMFATQNRLRVVDMTIPYMEMKATVLLRRPPKGAEPRITSLEDLINQSEIKFGTLNAGVIKYAFRTSNNSLYRIIWRRMQRFRDDAFTRTNQEGIYKVRREKYAFILPDTIGEYLSMRPPCDLITLDPFLLTRGYAWGVRKGSELLPQLNSAISLLRKNGVLTRLRRKWWLGRNVCDGITSSKVYSYSSTSPSTKKLCDVTSVLQMLVFVYSMYAITS